MATLEFQGGNAAVNAVREHAGTTGSTGWSPTAFHPRSPPARQLLDLARSFSVQCLSEPVLCLHFRPGVHLLVSADSVTSAAAPVSPADDRLAEVQGAIEDSRLPPPPKEGWRTALLSFGLVRWWSAAAHERAVRAFGPFKLVLDCRVVPADGLPR